jgi:hypothetical protein
MELFIQGGGKVRLNPPDFVAQGGEGAVYAQGDIAYKIYHDPARMIPLGKIQQLAALDAPPFIRPLEVLLDLRNRPVGYTMRRVRDAFGVCQLVTRAFRERRGVTPDAMLRLALKLRAGVQQAHDRDILLVDLNEMNLLADLKREEILFLDVDSYQTRGFPATAILDSVRDRHATDFSEATDWFAFAIVSFQMFVGIHPYKGKHPTLLDLDARMQANVSVFHPQVTLPQVCYPFDVIPPIFRDWYRAVFEEGERCPPPTDARGTVLVRPKVQRIADSDRLQIEERFTFPAEIVAPIFAGGNYAAVTTEGLLVGNGRVLANSDLHIALTPRRNHIVAAWQQDGRLKLYDVTQRNAMVSELACDAVTEAGGRLIVRHDDSLHEVTFLEFPAGTQATLTRIGNALPNATQVFEGVAVQNLLGAVHVSLSPRPGACNTLRIKELDAYRIVDGKFDSGVLMLVGVQGGRYTKFILRFDARYESYDLRLVPDIAYSGLNFVTLDSGVCVHLNESEELELFSHRKDSPNVRLLADNAVAGMRLFKNGAQVFGTRGATLYSLTMRT